MNLTAQIIRNALADHKAKVEFYGTLIVKMECTCDCTMIRSEDGAAECSECGYRPGGRFCDASTDNICEFAYPRGEACIHCGTSAN